MEKIKVIKHYNHEIFERLVNDFTERQRKDIVIVKHQIDVVATNKTVFYSAIFHYVTVDEYKKLLEVQQQMQQPQAQLQQPEMKITKPKRSYNKKPKQKEVLKVETKKDNKDK